MKHLVIIGARGWGREVLSLAKTTTAYKNQEWDIKGFLDDKSDALEGYKGEYPPILGSVEDYIIKKDDVFVCALGDPMYRQHYVNIIKQKGGSFVSIISPGAFIDKSAIIGSGSVICDNSMISESVVVGEHAMIHPFTSMGHNSQIGDFVSLESYVFICGGGIIGNCSYMRVRSSLISRKKIGNNVIVGAHSLVMRNIKDNVHVFGAPAVKIDM